MTTNGFPHMSFIVLIFANSEMPMKIIVNLWPGVPFSWKWPAKNSLQKQQYLFNKSINF